MALAPSGNATAGDGMKIEGKARSVLFLTFAVFFILGGVTNINDVLIPKLKNLYQLSHFEANLTSIERHSLTFSARFPKPHWQSMTWSQSISTRS